MNTRDLKDLGWCAFAITAATVAAALVAVGAGCHACVLAWGWLVDGERVEDPWH